MRATVAADIRGIFISEDLPHAETRLAELVVKYEKSAAAAGEGDRPADIRQTGQRGQALRRAS